MEIEHMNAHICRFPTTAGNGPGFHRDRARANDTAEVATLIVLHSYLDITLRQRLSLVWPIGISLRGSAHGDDGICAVIVIAIGGRDRFGSGSSAASGVVHAFVRG